MSVLKSATGLIVCVSLIGCCLSISAPSVRAEWSWRTPFNGAFGGETNSDSTKSNSAKTKSKSSSKAKPAVSNSTGKSKPTPVKNANSEKGFFARTADAMTPGKPKSTVGSKPFSTTPKRPLVVATDKKQGSSWFGSWGAAE